jgi:hypothetical protein
VLLSQTSLESRLASIWQPVVRVVRSKVTALAGSQHCLSLAMISRWPLPVGVAAADVAAVAPVAALAAADFASVEGAELATTVLPRLPRLELSSEL